MLLRCVSINHVSGAVDPDLRVGGLYTVVDPVDTMAGEYVTVRALDGREDLTRPSYLFRPVRRKHEASVERTLLARSISCHIGGEMVDIKRNGTALMRLPIATIRALHSTLTGRSE
jgi:hypothetical protein